MRGYWCQVILAKRRLSPTKNILTESAYRVAQFTQFAKVMHRMHYKEGVFIKMQIKMPSKWRVNATVSEEVLKKLETWAAQENRSVSSLVATILREAAKSHDEGVYLHSQSFPNMHKEKSPKMAKND